MTTNDSNNTETAGNVVDEKGLTAEVRARVPKWMKEGVSALAGDRVLDDADIVREAVVEYLERHDIKKPAKEVAA